MNKYNNYNSEFFLANDEFVNWVKSGASINGTYWEELAHSDPVILSEMERAKLIIQDWENTPSQLSDEQLSEGVRQIMKRVNERVDRNAHFKAQFWFRVAAVILFAIGLGWVIKDQFYDVKNYSYEKLITQVEYPLIEIRNDKEPKKQVLLPDGSQIMLSKGSQISYSKHFVEDSTRNVYLKGDGFFEVAKDKKHPFLVYANGLVTRVVGTSFHIYSKGGSTSVVVRSGKVAVYRMKEYEENVETDFLLTPNQEAVFVSDKNELSKKLVENPVALQGEKSVLNYNFVEAPVSSVFDSLENGYGIAIVYDPEVLKNCTITIPFREEPFYKKLDIICRTIQARYQIFDNKIMIISKGCN